MILHSAITAGEWSLLWPRILWTPRKH